MYIKPFSEPLYDVYMPFAFHPNSITWGIYISPRIKNTNVTSASKSDQLHLKKKYQRLFSYPLIKISLTTFFVNFLFDDDNVSIILACLLEWSLIIIAELPLSAREE